MKKMTREKLIRIAEIEGYTGELTGLRITEKSGSLIFKGGLIFFVYYHDSTYNTRQFGKNFNDIKRELKEESKWIVKE